MKTIVTAVDFSDATPHVVNMATHISSAMGAQLHLIHVVESREPTYVAYGFLPDQFPVLQELEAESLNRAEEKLRDTGCPAYEYLVLQGRPLHSILDYTEKVSADLLILGSHGHGLIGAIVTGSVAEGCVRKSKVPTLVVPVE
ncbi:MAG: universal stress protein [Akkermansiaceae bacterium]